MFKPVTEYIKSVMEVDAAAGNELLKLNMAIVTVELGIKVNTVEQGKKINQ